jgi:hypothetical protein
MMNPAYALMLTLINEHKREHMQETIERCNSIVNILYQYANVGIQIFNFCSQSSTKE